MKKFLIALLFVGAFSGNVIVADQLDEINVSDMCCSLEAKLAEIEARIPCLEGNDKCLLEDQKRNIEDVIQQLQEIEETKGLMTALKAKTVDLQEFFAGLQKKTIILAVGAGLIALTGLGLMIWGIVSLKNNLEKANKENANLKIEKAVLEDDQKEYAIKMAGLTGALGDYAAKYKKAEDEIKDTTKLAEKKAKLAEELETKVTELKGGVEEKTHAEELLRLFAKEHPKDYKKLEKSMYKDLTEEQRKNKEAATPKKIKTIYDKVAADVKKEKEESKKKKKDEKKTP